MSSANQRQDEQQDKEGKKKERKEDKPARPGESAEHRRHQEEEQEIDDHDSEQDALEELECLEELADMIEGHLYDNSDDDGEELMDMIEGHLEVYSDDDDGDDDDESNEFDDGEESLMSNGEQQKPKEEMSEGKANNTTLLPWDFKSVSEAIQRFVDTFKARYGDNAPPFFVGELKDAAEKAFEPELFEDRKLLALYLHNDHAVAHNIFPTKVLCSSQVSALLRHQFVVWPWDKTLPVNRERLDAYFDAAGMRAVNEMLARVKEDKYPLLVVVGSIGGKEKKHVPLVVISGRHDAETAMERLLIGLDHHMTTVSMERSQRDLADQFRQDEQQEEDAVKAQHARGFSKEGAGEFRRKEPPIAGEMLRRANLAALLPPEPDPAASEGVVTVKARLPDGGEATRRFPATSALSFLVHWLHSLGYDESHHKFLTSAQEDISTMDQSKSFADLGWMRREQVMVIDTA